jgi:hypothetical protein
MTHDGPHELPQGTWCLRLTLEPQALDAPAAQWAVFAEDPKRRFTADLRVVEEHLKESGTLSDERKPGLLVAGWNRLFRLIPGDRVYLLTPSGQHGLTTNEQGGHKWVATKTVRSGVPSNKGMQLTRPVQIAASQLIPSVGRTTLGARGREGVR